jgi:hypothetical protein
MEREADATLEVPRTSSTVEGVRQHNQSHQMGPAPTGAGEMTRPHARTLDDPKINVRLKLSALWTATLVLYAYGDIFGFFRPGFIDDIKAKKVAGFHIDQVFLLGASMYIFIPTVMIFLSLTLKPVVNRWANIILGTLYTVSVLLSCIGETWAYYIFLSIAESALLLLIVWYAWKWPKET